MGKRPKHSKNMKLWWKKFKETSPLEYLLMMEKRSKNHMGYQTMLGKHHSKETKEKIRKGNLGKKPSYPNPVFIERLGHIVRSTLERDTLLKLKREEIEYKYEKRIDLYIDGKWRSYYVDAWILESNTYIECKGWFDDYSVKKMTEFRKQNPAKRLYVITYRRNKKIPKGCCDKIFYIEEIEDLIIELKSERKNQCQTK